MRDVRLDEQAEFHGDGAYQPVEWGGKRSFVSRAGRFGVGILTARMARTCDPLFRVSRTSLEPMLAAREVTAARDGLAFAARRSISRAI
jgi:hypothetical protein